MITLVAGVGGVCPKWCNCEDEESKGEDSGKDPPMGDNDREKKEQQEVEDTAKAQEHIAEQVQEVQMVLDGGPGSLPPLPPEKKVEGDDDDDDGGYETGTQTREATAEELENPTVPKPSQEESKQEEVRPLIDLAVRGPPLPTRL